MECPGMWLWIEESSYINLLRGTGIRLSVLVTHTVLEEHSAFITQEAGWHVHLLEGPFSAQFICS